MRTRTLIAVLALAAPAAALAQSSPFLPDARLRALVNEISGDRVVRARAPSQPLPPHGRQPRLLRRGRVPARRGGGRGARGRRSRPPEVGRPRLVVPRAARRGCSTRSPRSSRTTARWRSGSRTTAAPRTPRRSSSTSAPAARRRTTRAARSRGEVVLASGSLSTVVREAVWKRGALGIVSSMTNRPDAIDAPDQVAWGQVPYEAKGVEGVKDGTPGGFAVMVSPRRGLRAAEAARGRRDAAARQGRHRGRLPREAPSRRWSRPGSAAARSTTSRSC